LEKSGWPFEIVKTVNLDSSNILIFQVKIRKLSISSDSAIQQNHFGNEMVKKHFLFSEGFINFNHGSFGTVPAIIASKQMEFFRLQESRPDRLTLIITVLIFF
jgi:hypothetical protein